MLIEVPPGFLDGLPTEDQQAFRDIVGKPIRLNECDDNGRAELEFTDASGVVHFISEPKCDPACLRKFPAHQMTVDEVRRWRSESAQ